MAPLRDLLHKLKTKFEKQVDSSTQTPPRIIHPTVSKGSDEDEVRAMFEAWMIKHEKSYNSFAEKEKRFQIFKECHRDIEEKNKSVNIGWQEGLNQFSDLTFEETMLTLTGCGCTSRDCPRCQERYAFLTGVTSFT